MCHATLAGRKAGSVSTNKSQFVDKISTNMAYHQILLLFTLLLYQRSIAITAMFSNCSLDSKTKTKENKFFFKTTVDR